MLKKSLAELEKRRLDVRRVEREKKNAKKYRGIRFIEGRKLSRKLKQLKRALSGAEGNERQHIETEMQKVTRDLVYIKHYPNRAKYVSILLPATEENATHIERIRAEIERKLQNEAIVAEADEGAGLGGGMTAVGSLGEASIAEQDDFFLDEGDVVPLSTTGTASAPGSLEAKEVNSSPSDDEIALGFTVNKPGRGSRGGSVQKKKRESRIKENGRHSSSEAGEQSGRRSPGTLGENELTTNGKSSGGKSEKKRRVVRNPDQIGKGKTKPKVLGKSKRQGKDSPTSARTRAEGGRKRRRKRI